MFLLETQEGKEERAVKGPKEATGKRHSLGGVEERTGTVHLTALCSGGLLSCFVSGGYEPPLTNVFTMQWFLTLFATCLPNHTVLKIWDSVFFEGSEIILRVSLAIWAKLGE